MRDERSIRLKEIEDTRCRLGRLVQEYEHDYGVNSYLNRAPRLQPDHLEGATLLVDRYALLGLLPKNGTVVEVGVDRGDFSLRIAATGPSSLVLVDIDLSRLSPANEKTLRGLPFVRLLQCDSAEYLSNLPERSCDWIYIDASHLYANVRRDIISSFNKVKVGGYLVFNDYTMWSPAGMVNYGVSRAVNEFLNEKSGWIVAYFALQGGGYHDIALRKTG